MVSPEPISCLLVKRQATASAAATPATKGYTPSWLAWLGLWWSRSPGVSLQVQVRIDGRKWPDLERLPGASF